MTRVIQVEYKRQRYTWDGYTWRDPQTYIRVHDLVVSELDKMVSLEDKQLLAAELAMEAHRRSVERFSHLVDSYLRAKVITDTRAIRSCTLELYETIDHLRLEHINNPFDTETVQRIMAEQRRSGLDFPEQGFKRVAICWDCNRHGVRTVVDMRVDPECELCGWGICSKCATCQDPKFGECPGNHTRAGRSPKN